MIVSNTGTIFANKGTDGTYTADVGGVKLAVTPLSDTQLGFQFGDHKVVEDAKFSKFGKMYLVTLPVNGSTRYIASERENQRGKFLMLKVAKNQGDSGSAAPAQQAYGTR
jgi:hypothetical protein